MPRLNNPSYDIAKVWNHSTQQELEKAIITGSFHYYARNGIDFTAQAEIRKIKKGKTVTITPKVWWYAYVFRAGKTYKMYVAKADRITLEKLEIVAQKLAIKMKG